MGKKKATNEPGLTEQLLRAKDAELKRIAKDSERAVKRLTKTLDKAVKRASASIIKRNSLEVLELLPILDLDSQQIKFEDIELNEVAVGFGYDELAAVSSSFFLNSSPLVFIPEEASFAVPVSTLLSSGQQMFILVDALPIAMMLLRNESEVAERGHIPATPISWVLSWLNEFSSQAEDPSDTPATDK